ncbi:hypothetical protein OAI84_00265 [bacterium]|nr:hypothetical protein [bacterium]
MKLLETRFEEYINSVKKNNLYPKLYKIYKQFPDDLIDLPNIIFYGPPGCGKYTQALLCIYKYSKNKLKYERKINIMYNNQKIEIFRISDIHYEIDMNLLGCNAKGQWSSFFYHILDILNIKEKKEGIILCKNFHKIDNELLNIFNGFMTNITNKNIIIKFILITEHIGFIPRQIISKSNIFKIPKLTKEIYKKKLNIKTLTNVNNITNLKGVKLNILKQNILLETLTNEIINQIINYKTIDLMLLRENLYKLFIYQLNVHEFLFFCLKILIEKDKISVQSMENLIIKTFKILKFFNNNYRPIYHLESFVLTLCKEINGF